jgi:hypothetical protein
MIYADPSCQRIRKSTNAYSGGCKSPLARLPFRLAWSSAGAVARMFLRGLYPRFPPWCPFRSVAPFPAATPARISRTMRSRTLHFKVYGTSRTATAKADG